ncbi:MAG: amidohydrolase family protein [Rubrivivax sp.]|nr:amidohydrolase family protein [Rubrivivax sp.]
MSDARSFSRRGVLRAGALAGLAAAAGPARTTRRGNAGRLGDIDELVLVNGRIHTMDARNSIARSVGIREGEFVYVGHDARGLLPHAPVIDLRGRTVVPGVVEGHVHIVSLANRPGYHTPIESADTIAEMQATLAARRPGVPEGQFITAMGGWHPNQFTDVRRVPTRAELDAAVSDRPVMIFQSFTGPSVVNSLGKAFLENASSPLAGPVAVADNGFVAAGAPSTTALYHLRVRQTFADKLRSTLDAMAFSAAVGVTANLDQVLFPTPGPLQPTQALSNLDHYRMYDPWLQLHREGRTIVRLQMNFLHNQNLPDLPELNERLRNQFQFFGDDMLMTGSIGEWAAPIGAGANWLEAQRLVAAARWRNENSVQSLAQLQQVVNAYEQMDQEFAAAGGIRDLRWMVHHVPFVTPELLTRLQALNCGVQMAAYRWVSSSATATGVGASFRIIVDHGIKAGIHGDGVHIAPHNPWLHMYYVVTGLNSFGVQVNAGQQLTRHEALRAFTRENAWFLRMEDRIGTIETGKLADLLVLDRDYFSVPEHEIRKVRPVLTVVDGDIVHDTGALGTSSRCRRRDTRGHADPRGRWD